MTESIREYLASLKPTRLSGMHVCPECLNYTPDKYCSGKDGEPHRKKRCKSVEQSLKDEEKGE